MLHVQDIRLIGELQRQTAAGMCNVLNARLRQEHFPANYLEFQQVIVHKYINKYHHKYHTIMKPCAKPDHLLRMLCQQLAGYTSLWHTLAHTHRHTHTHTHCICHMVNSIFLQFLLSVAVRQVFLTSTYSWTNNLFQNTVRVWLVVISTKHHYDVRFNSMGFHAFVKGSPFVLLCISSVCLPLGYYSQGWGWGQE